MLKTKVGELMTTDNERLFKAEVKKALVLRRWKYKDLAKAIGVSESSIVNLMCRQTRGSDELIERISKELNVPRYI